MARPRRLQRVKSVKRPIVFVRMTPRRLRAKRRYLTNRYWRKSTASAENFCGGGRRRNPRAGETPALRFSFALDGGGDFALGYADGDVVA